MIISLIRRPLLNLAMAGRPLGYSIMSWAGLLKEAAIKKENTPEDLSTLGDSVP